MRAFDLKDIPKKSADGVTLIPKYMDAVLSTQCQDLTWFLDVKLFDHEGEWEEYLDLFSMSLGEQIRAVNADERTIIECQIPGFLMMMSTTCPQCRLFFYAKDRSELEEMLDLRGEVQWATEMDGVSVNKRFLDEELRARIRQADLKLAVFGCSGMSANSECASFDPDYIQTDDVELVADSK